MRGEFNRVQHVPIRPGPIQFVDVSNVEDGLVEDAYHVFPSLIQEWSWFEPTSGLRRLGCALSMPSSNSL